jgi:hypothetical protein
MGAGKSAKQQKRATLELLPDTDHEPVRKVAQDKGTFAPMCEVASEGTEGRARNDVGLPVAVVFTRAIASYVGNSASA